MSRDMSLPLKCMANFGKMIHRDKTKKISKNPVKLLCKSLMA